MHAGLSTAEAERLLSEVGPNELDQEPATPPWRVLLRQFDSPAVWLLLAACVASAALGDLGDSLAIGAILTLNAVVGAAQEFRAERALRALGTLTAPTARVVRDEHARVVPAALVVPGDLLLLEAGDIVAADAKLLEAQRLKVNEATLTGESAAVDKTTEPCAPNSPLAERRDSVFKGTTIADGTARAEVVATGMRTELGNIAHLISHAEAGRTPLQIRLAALSRLLLYICLAVVAIVAVLGLLHNQAKFDVFLSAVSLAVASVPEGLPAVVTIALAIGVRRMAQRNVLVKRLSAVETLGSATVICSDKTGTLTTGEMTVRELWGTDEQRLLHAGAACCDAELAPDGRTGTGDPTEIAILVAARERGISAVELERAAPKTQTNPFDSVRKRMSVRRSDGRLYVKGAAELLAPLCVRGTDGALEKNSEMAARGLRVLAVALGEGEDERDLELLGLIGIADPPRPEVIRAIASARKAGVKTVMITGDHPATARAIASELGILGGDDEAEVVRARATPESKLEIVRDFKARGHVVAMTGDGVNDAPAIREAHIGIAMGKTGTEVTREASDLVLADDNFASIVAALCEGRAIFDNIQRTIVYLLTGNAGELALMLVAAAMGLPAPLLPLQLLWVNLVTDGAPALALVMEPADPGVLERPPRAPNSPILSRRAWATVASIGIVEGGVTLAAFVWQYRIAGVDAARAAAFCTLVFSEILRAMGARHAKLPIWRLQLLGNMPVVWVMLLSLVVQVLLASVPAVGQVFHSGLEPAVIAYCFVLALLPMTVVELLKLSTSDQH